MKPSGLQRVEKREALRYTLRLLATPGYLVGTLPDEGGEFGHHQVHTFQAGLFQFADLLFHYSLKSKVRGEQPRSEGQQICGSSSVLKEDRKEKGKGGRIKRENRF